MVQCNRQTSYAVLDGQYIVGEEIGSGGFGKVKLATHCLTREKVAIKIIDKKAIGEDLPRVTTELRALKTLQHQNICRLYQCIETEEKFFIVLEYCSGGELFDYIVKKECLQESEARHFFRQIVSSISFVHHMSFAHRDLKPENLLLTDDLQLKLIDFGLCANPESGLTNVLETCCGSPAYAAPELIAGQKYFGNEADIWSMGVLLYALLCGCLPFEDDNMQILYKKIQTGKYDEPPWLSNESKSLLRAMLQTDPKRRITTKELQSHPWINKDYTHPLKWRSIYDSNIVDQDCAKELSLHHGIPFEKMIEKIRKWEYDNLTSTYFLLLRRKRKGQPVVLPPPPRKPNCNSEGSNNLLNSPTIHASLDSNLDKSGLESDVFETAFVCPQIPRQLSREETSYAQAINCGTNVQMSQFTPVRYRPTRPNKENVDPRPHSARRPVKANYNTVDGNRPKSVYKTPAKPPVPVTQKLLSPNQGWNQETPTSAKIRSRSTDRMTPGSEPVSPSVSTPGSGRTPRSKSKTPHRRRGVFASVERKVDKMINLLTPRRVRMDHPTILKHTQALVNVSTASTDDPNLVLNELIRVFEAKGISCEQNGWKLAGKAKDKLGRTKLTLELEVVFVDHLNVVGVKRKRLNGDSMMYKRVCEDILNLASL